MTFFYSSSSYSMVDRDIMLLKNLRGAKNIAFILPDLIHSVHKGINLQKNFSAADYQYKPVQI